MQIQLTKEQQDAVDRIKVEGDFDELYYEGPLRRGRVVVRFVRYGCDGPEQKFIDLERILKGFSV
jgi:hypothetical protein